MSRMPRRKVSLELEKVIVEKVLVGETIPNVAKELGLDKSTIREYAIANGVKFKNSFHKGYIITHNGYKKLLRKDHHLADSKGYVAEHILVAEEGLGRDIKKNEVVHHIDHNKLNNLIENLQVMTKSEHTQLHASEGTCGWTKYHAKMVNRAQRGKQR